MSLKDTFSVSNTTRGKVPSLPFESIKNTVLGKNYELSLVFCGNKLSKRLNKTYREKDKATNILSFPISNPPAGGTGEIFINLSHLKGFSIGHLFIHGLYHLKGFDHGDTMERAEKILRKKFKI